MGRQNAKTLDRDRTSYSFNAALAAQTASPFNFEIEPENIILVALRAFEFSHSLDPAGDIAAEREALASKPDPVQRVLSFSLSIPAPEGAWQSPLAAGN